MTLAYWQYGKEQQWRPLEVKVTGTAFAVLQYEVLGAKALVRGLHISKLALDVKRKRESMAKELRSWRDKLFRRDIYINLSENVFGRSRRTLESSPSAQSSFFLLDLLFPL